MFARDRCPEASSPPRHALRWMPQQAHSHTDTRGRQGTSDTTSSHDNWITGLKFELAERGAGARHTHYRGYSL